MIKVAVSENLEVLAFALGGVLTIVSFEALTSVDVLSSIDQPCIVIIWQYYMKRLRNILLGECGWY